MWQDVTSIQQWFWYPHPFPPLFATKGARGSPPLGRGRRCHGHRQNFENDLGVQSYTASSWSSKRKKKHPKMVIKWGWKMDEKCEQSSKSSLLSLRCQGCGSILQHRSLIRLVVSRPHWANHDPPSSRHGHRAVARPKGHGCCNWVKPACAGRKVSCKGPFFLKIYYPILHDERRRERMGFQDCSLYHLVSQSM